jgi:homoserine dehydrogenase
VTAPDGQAAAGRFKQGPAPLRVAVLGSGVVGTEVVRLLVTQSADLAARVGAPLELVGVAVRDLTADRDPVVDRALLTTDAAELVTRADIVVEVIGGVEPARTLLLSAIEHGAAVVTANKALLAQDGPTLYAAADAAQVDLYFEAAVAGAIPIVRPVRSAHATSSAVTPLMPSRSTSSIDTRVWNASEARIAAFAAASYPSTSAVGSASA